MPHDITDRSITTLNKGKPTKQMINQHFTIRKYLENYTSAVPQADVHLLISVPVSVTWCILICHR